MNAFYKAELRTSFRKHVDYHQQKYRPKDISPSGIRRDERDVISVITILTEAFIDPFGEKPLVGISTGIEIRQSLSYDILAAEEKGQKAMVFSFRKDWKETNPKIISLTQSQK